MVKAEVVICVIPELGPAVPPHTHSLGLGFAFGSPLRRGQEETRRRVVFYLTQSAVLLKLVSSSPQLNLCHHLRSLHCPAEGQSDQG